MPPTPVFGKAERVGEGAGDWLKPGTGPSKRSAAGMEMADSDEMSDEMTSGDEAD